MANEHPRPQPTRGVIIVDSGALLRMCVPLDEQFLNAAATKKNLHKRHPVRLTDALAFLSQHGYEVVIPEMVAVECGGYMRDGKSIQSCPGYFRSGAKFHMISGEFLETIPALQAAGANIRIQPPLEGDTSPEAKYLQRMYEAHSSTMEPKDKRSAFGIAENEFKARNNAGDRAAYALAQSYKDSPVPVFYLSNDIKASKRIGSLVKEGVPARELGDLGFYNALLHKGILQLLGIKAAKDVEISAYMKYAIGALVVAVDKRGFTEADGNFFDVVPGDDPNRPQHGHPFADSLIGLRKEKEQARNKAKVKEEDPAPEPEKELAPPAPPRERHPQVSGDDAIRAEDADEAHAAYVASYQRYRNPVPSVTEAGSTGKLIPEISGPYHD